MGTFVHGAQSTEMLYLKNDSNVSFQKNVMVV